MNNITYKFEYLVSYINAIIYFKTHKVIQFYDRVDPEGTMAFCSSFDFPKYNINGLGRIDYLDENRKYINYKYYI